MPIRFRRELVAPCGMNCNICASYLAKQFDVRAKGVKMAYCAGCRPREKRCAPLKQRCGRMPVEPERYCSECTGFCCPPLATLDARYRARYRMSMVENLASITKHGIAGFLRKERKKWRCPRCGGTISCHNGLCFQCNIDRLRTMHYKYQWE